ncbi:uncharacterized protein BCR38DRAFT_333742 [Pseudomassariella vexata]|uniref:PHD-type domain-containing protein n=1 Tax=Pseudomassariella vexata TaxID=1141098 RepID=A0A1Y2EDU4_9PEZI|nr:uncharacterized protein BCR38DRAFT_333742 [Pseudomassariella vexata]ORY69751.1 hypothetical protein BCR38DRAFT_333742 [Pseudomassariella vexata]
MSGGQLISRQEISWSRHSVCLGLISDRVYSFGDPNAQPPTPNRTPTSVVFPSPVFETPKNNRGPFEDSSSWTPRFVEEYSVFNATPGNLRGAQGPFADFYSATPYPNPTGHKRPLSAENIAAEIAAHVNHFIPNTNLPLPPVDPSRRLASSPGPLTTGGAGPPSDSHFQERSVKKVRRRTLEEDLARQTVTPPPSACKGERKLAPKIQTEIMHNDQGYGQEYGAGTSQQNTLPNLVTSPTDMFGYAISAPATAPVFTDSGHFWDGDMSGMDIDFSTAAANVYQAPSHRPMNSLDWGRSNEMFQPTGAIPQQPQNQENRPIQRRERALAPKPALPNLESSDQDASMYGASFTTPIDNSFSMVRQGGGVDPGLLFSRPSSSGTEMAAFDRMAQASLTQSMLQPEPLQHPVKPVTQGGLRRSATTRETGATNKLDRTSASSPSKPSGRPGLSRSMSENRGKKSASRATTLPTLAPAIRPTPQQPTSRSVPKSSRSNGRTSPSKSHHRLSSLSSIPEATGPKTRTSVKFTIDSRGRARAETTTVVVDDDDEETTPRVIRCRKPPRNRSRELEPSDDDASSSDDEPIIIPSRNLSFALPDPIKPSSSHPFQPSQSSINERSISSLGIYFHEPNHNDVESEAETVLNEPQSSRGDAASELRKMIENRQKWASLNTSQRFVSGPSYSNSSTISPTTEGGLPTPTSSRGNIIKCVCNNTETPRNTDGFMVQCESCENWLHGKCINIISRQEMPCVYICAFCANTPAHGARDRDAGRNVGVPSRESAASPLAHKSFQSFR